MCPLFPPGNEGGYGPDLMDTITNKMFIGPLSVVCEFGFTDLLDAAPGKRPIASSRLMTQFASFATQSDAATTGTSWRYRVTTPAREGIVSRRALDHDRGSER